MQPYLFPYIGYFQLINSADEFIIYDNIQYTKKGWINRNRILVNGSEAFVTLPLKKDSDYAAIKDRYLSNDWPTERKKIINRIKESYRKAPQFSIIFPLIESILMQEEKNLFKFILHSIVQLNLFLEIKTPIVISSSIDINHDLKAENKVIALCKARHADKYINPIGGITLYNKDHFMAQGIELQFIKACNITYPQFENEFVPFLSIIDVLMFNPLTDVIQIIKNEYDLI